MPDSSCAETMTLLNALFGSGIILNDGHEILARLEAGEEPIVAVEECATKFGTPAQVDALQRVGRQWPALHLQAVSEMVRWALSKLDTDDRLRIQWKGDAESPETITRFELRDHTLLIEFAHPPGLI